MPTIRPGARRDTFAARCMSSPDKNILECLGDKVAIDGIQTAVYFDREMTKYDDGDVGVLSSTITACWLKCHMDSARRGSVLARDGQSFTMKTDPTDMFDGWVCVEMKYCGIC